MYNILYIGYIYVMARVTSSAQALPSILAEQLATLGTNLRLARKRRRISRAAMAERMMVNPKTVDRMEKGDPALGIGIIAVLSYEAAEVAAEGTARTRKPLH